MDWFSSTRCPKAIDTVNMKRVWGIARMALDVFYRTPHRKAKSVWALQFHTCHLCSEACNIPSGYHSGLRSSLFLGWQSNAQTDGEQKASTHEGGCSVPPKSCRNRTHVHRTPPNLPNDQIPQSSMASNRHRTLDGEHSTMFRRAAQPEAAMCILIKQFMCPELQAAGRELLATEQTTQKMGQGRR